VDTIDRAMRELVTIGAVTVEHRYDGPQRLTNRYHLHARRPDGASNDFDASSGSGRPDAATPQASDQPDLASAAGGGRKNAAGVAAPVRHNPKHFTQSTTTSPQPPAAPADGQNLWRAEEDRFLHSLGIGDADAYTADIAALRRDAGGPSARWACPSLVAALQAAVKARGWPAEHAAHALRIVAADPATRSPMRLAEVDRGGTKPSRRSTVATASRGTTKTPSAARLAASRSSRSRPSWLRPTGCASTCKPKPARSCAPNANPSPGRRCSAEPTNSCNSGNF